MRTAWSDSTRYDTGVPESWSGVRNHPTGVVDTTVPSGALVRVAVQLDCDPDVEVCFGGEGEVISLITRASADELGIAPGLRVSANSSAICATRTWYRAA